METKEFHVSVFYQCLVTRDCWPIGRTYLVTANDEDEAILKVKKDLWKKEITEYPELGKDTTEEEWCNSDNYVENYKDTLVGDIHMGYKEEEGYVVEISEQVKL